MEKIARGLPRTTSSVCPECKAILKARLFEKDRKVMMEKECPQHGKFEDVVWSDVDMWRKAEKWAFDGKGVDNPRFKGKTIEDCPFVCGLCNIHLSHTCLANLDLTNRCNLSCPICFANAAATGRVYEPSFEQVVEMMKELRKEKPVPCPSIQFAGGEPTIYPRFSDVIREARKLSFAQIQVATNGLKLAEPGFCQKMVDAGMHTVYLQFDGFKKETYKKTRGREDLLEIKLRAIENCRETKPNPLAVVLVGTMMKGINDGEAGEVVKYATKNSDVIRAVNFQPVSFTGRIDREERQRQRYTLPDLVHDLEEQTDFLRKDDFYPVPVVAPISELISTLSREEKVSFTCHYACGLATLLFINNGQVTPITRFVDVEGFITRVKELRSKAKWLSFFIKLLSKKSKDKESLKKAFNKYFGEFIDESKMPEGVDIIDFISSLVSERNKKTLGEFTWKTMMIGGMHFQDSYNYDIQRVRRCVIHYVTPDLRIIPFCAYNGGPTFREEVESKFSIPLKEWKEKNK